MEKIGKNNGASCVQFFTALLPLAFFCPPMHCLVTATPRGEIRARHGIKSDCDFFITLACQPCALIQEAKQVNKA